MSTLTVPHFNHSGLGDRLCGMLLIVLYSRMCEYSKVRVPWPEYWIPHENAPDYRKEDIKLSSVVEHLILPKDIEFIEAESLPFEVPWWHVQVGIGAPDFLWMIENHLKDIKGDAIYMAKRICSECGYSEKIITTIKELGDYASIHLRRTDKIREHNPDEEMTHTYELDELNTKTKNIIRVLKSSGHTRFFVCSDDDEATVEYKDFISDMGCEVVELPKMKKSLATYYDMAAMSMSKMIVQSQRNSAFSNYASCIGNVPLWKVYQDQPLKFI